jgi:hypothetical protein
MEPTGRRTKKMAKNTATSRLDKQRRKLLRFQKVILRVGAKKKS